METRTLFAWASAAARSQPVTPPIFMTSGMIKSDALASSACWRSTTPHQFSPHCIGCLDLAGDQGVAQVIVGEGRLLDPGQLLIVQYTAQTQQSCYQGPSEETPSELQEKQWLFEANLGLIVAKYVAELRAFATDFRDDKKP